MKKFAQAGLLTLAFSALAMAQPKPKSQAEVTALQGMFSALNNPALCVKAGEDVLANFANTEFKSVVLGTMADCYNRNGDSVKAIAYGEQALETDPKNYQALLLLAQTIASHVGPDDLDLATRLAEADKYANQAIPLIQSAPKMNAGITDEQWTAQKKDLTADAHQALGMSNVARKKYDVAVAEFKLALEGASIPEPATMVRLGQTYNKMGKYDDAIAILDKTLAIPDANTAIKQFAQAERVRAVMAKSAKK